MTLEVSPDGTSVNCDASCLQSINGVADWDNEALTQARNFLVSCMQTAGAWGVNSEAETTLFTGSAQALHFVLAWPEVDQNAATIPQVKEQFLDPHVFKADLPLAGDPTTIETHTYEHFTLAGAYSPRVGSSSNSSVFLVEPTMVDRATQISLAQPAWLSRHNVTQPQNMDELKMVAIAVDNAGFKLNLKGWTPTHYWGPGLVEQIITSNEPVVVSFTGNLSEPAIRCADFQSDIGSPDGSGLSKCETLNSPVGLRGNAKGGSPWQQLVGQQQLMTNALTRWEDMKCMSTAELRDKGFVLDGALHLLPSYIRHAHTQQLLPTHTLNHSPILLVASRC